MFSVVGQVLFNLHFKYNSSPPAEKLTRLSLIAMQVLCNLYCTILQSGRLHSLVCVHALCYTILLSLGYYKYVHTSMRDGTAV